MTTACGIFRFGQLAAKGLSFLIAFSGICFAPSAMATNPLFGPPPPSGAATSTAIPQPRIKPQVIHLPVVDAPRMQFSRITTADGLSQTRVAQIVQDDQGFMWFGTQYGLNRYDGYNFKVFVHDPHRPGSLAGAFITALFKDATGNLWVGSNQTLDRLDPRTEVITHFRVAADGDVTRSTVVHISQDRLGYLWLASGTGLYRMDPRSGQMMRYAHDANDPRSLSTNDIKWSGEDRSGQLWVGTANGLEQFDARTKSVQFKIPIREGVRTRFFEDHLGVFWIAYVSGSGLAVFDRKSNTLTRYSFYVKDPPPNALTGVTAIFEDRAGHLWLGSHGIGLMEFDREHRRFLRSRHILGDAESISEENIIALAQDREGNIWTGSHSSGANHFSTGVGLFRTYKREAGNPRGLRLDFANAVYPGKDNILWIGNDDGLNRLDRNTGANTIYTFGLGLGPIVITITADTKGYLWIGTAEFGLVRFDPKNDNFKIYRHEPNDSQSLSNDEVHRVFVDHRGTLWVGTDDGLDRYNPLTDNFTVYKVDPDDRQSQSYLAIAEDKAGMLWLGTHYSGLHRFDPATGRFKVYQSDPANPDALRDNMVAGVLIDQSGAVWAATQNGLGRVDPRTSQISTFESEAELSGYAVQCLLADRDGTLWAGSTRGLLEYNPASRTLERYSIADGLPGNDMTGWGTCAKSQSGEMFYTSFAGAVSFFPESMQPIVEMPPVVLTNLEIFGSPPDTLRIPMSKAINYADNLVLTHKENIFSIAFAALTYRNSSTVRYRYRLEGLETNWIEVGSDRRRATYTTLPTGRYTFRVQAALSRGPWSEPGAALRIVILPSWWQTWYFRAAYSVAIVFGLCWLYQLRLRQLARRFNMTLDARVDERMRIARALHDTLLQSFHALLLRFQTVAVLLPNRPAEAKRRLESAIEQAGEAITEGRDAVAGLRSSAREAKGLDVTIRTLGEEFAAADTNRNSAVFRMDVDGAPRELYPSLADEIYRIAAEALRNAFQHAHACRIEVQLMYGEQELRLRVRDDGTGVDPKFLTEEGRAGHYGFHGMRERAKTMGGKLTLWSELESGTEIELGIPASRVYAAMSSSRRSWILEELAGERTDEKETNT